MRVSFEYCSVNRFISQYSSQNCASSSQVSYEVYARWMPKQLKPEQQAVCMMTRLDSLQCCDTDEEAMLERVVTD